MVSGHSRHAAPGTAGIGLDVSPATVSRAGETTTVAVDTVERKRIRPSVAAG